MHIIVGIRDHLDTNAASLRGIQPDTVHPCMCIALNIEKIEDIVNRNVLSLYNRIFKVERPARRLMQHLLSRFIFYGETVPGTLLDRVVSMGESPTKRAFNSQHVPKTSVTNNDGLVDSIRHLLFTDNFTKPYSHEHLLVQLLTTSL